MSMYIQKLQFEKVVKILAKFWVAFTEIFNGKSWQVLKKNNNKTMKICDEYISEKAVKTFHLKTWWQICEKAMNLKSAMKMLWISEHIVIINVLYIQLNLIISKSKGLSEILRDIRTSTYQICRIKKKKLEQPHFTNKYVIWLLKLEIYWKYCGKEEKLLLRSNFLFSTIFCYL